MVLLICLGMLVVIGVGGEGRPMGRGFGVF